MIEIEYEFREKDLVHFNEMRLKYNKTLQDDMRRNRFLMPGILLFLGLFYYVYYMDIKTSLYLGGIAIVWGFVSPYITKMDLRRQFLEKYTEKEKVALFSTHTLVITETHLLEKSESGKHRMDWKDLVRVEYGEKYVYIYVDLNSAIIIPVESVKKGDLEKFAEIVAEKIAQVE